VPIGQFLEEGIPNAMIEFAHDLGREAISVRPSSYPSRYQLDKASRLVEKGTSTFPPYRELSNTFFVEKGRLLSKRSGQIVPYDTYVFNAGDNTWQHDSSYAMTPQKAQKYLLAKEGHFPKELGFSAAVSLVQSCHAVVIVDDESYGNIETVCDCAAFWETVSCSHIAAVDHLRDRLNIEQRMARIPNAHQRGPRGRAPPVGYSAHMPKQPTVKDINPIDKVGTMIAMRFGTHDEGNDEVFIGRVSGKYTHAQKI